jgi:hypothetical protein
MAGCCFLSALMRRHTWSWRVSIAATQGKKGRSMPISSDHYSLSGFLLGRVFCLDCDWVAGILELVWLSLFFKQTPRLPSVDWTPLRGRVRRRGREPSPICHLPWWLCHCPTTQFASGCHFNLFKNKRPWTCHHVRGKLKCTSRLCYASEVAM